MSGIFVLDWATIAVSLFNTILLLWLGLAVLLNAERRNPGIWLAAGGLGLGSLFFVSHSAILGRGLFEPGAAMDFWWRVGWVPVVALPIVWYAVMLWYAGYWEAPAGSLRRRHRPWLLLLTLLASAILALLAVANPLPAYWQVIQLDLSARPSLAGISVLLLAYPAYVVLCIGLALDALLRPGPSRRVMGDLARRRARPWLLGASAILLLVSLLVAAIVAWTAGSARQRAVYEVYTSLSGTVAAFDFIIAFLIGLSVVFLGQAIVSYEVFTGKTLPRRGLIRHWRRALVLAGGYGLVVGWSLTVHLRAVYGLLLTALLMTFFYALLSWRSYAERERFIEHLRPFVASQRLTERLLTPGGAAPGDVDVAALFEALCDDVLGARTAFLLPLGFSRPLVPGALSYPPGRPGPPPLPGEVVARFRSPQTACVALEPDGRHDACWAVPLWSERGLAGALLLGEKRDGGLYTQEEVEVARASGERLVDTLVSSEMARRVMALQRQRLAESRVVDQKARRTLHDDVLPLLHTAMLGLSGSQGAADADAVELLADAHRRISDLLHEMPGTAATEVARRGLAGALRHVVEGELAGAFDDVTWQIEPEPEAALAALPDLTAEVLFYAAREAVRNAARHGRGGDGDQPLHLRVDAARRAGALEIVVEDDGVGLLAAEASPENGGQGLALHSAMMAVVGGALAVESLPGPRTRVVLSLPPSSGQPAMPEV
ncbi:MAG: ATP-binding protein [Anaerolineae bacterium]